MNKYFKNVILCSDLDYHCLLCEESFEDIATVEKHIRWENHRKALKNQNYVPKYKKEFILKIKELYYCEICNCLLENEHLQDHMKSEDHKERKSNPILDNNNKKVALGTRDTNGLIKFPKLTINRLQWHLIDGMKCVLCDVNVQNVNDHISSSKHMVKLIQSQIVESNDCYFRKIAENKFCCFRCAVIVNEDKMQSHSCKKDKKTTNSAKKNKEQKKTCESPFLIKILADVEKDHYDINIKKKTARCKLCTSNVDLNTSALFKHREDFHPDTIKYIDPQDHGKLRAELAAYGRENFIKLNERGSRGYCSLCDINISAHIKQAKAHVNGTKHRGHLELKGLIASKKHSLPGRRVQSFQNFLRHMFHVRPLNAFCINHSLLVNELSFMFVAQLANKHPLKRKCFCCDAVFNTDQLKEHLESKKHREALLAADLLVMDNEFIRIIRQGLFHCGFCNQVFPFWETMKKHIESLQHKYAQKNNEVASLCSMRWFSEKARDKFRQIKITADLSKQLLQLGVSRFDGHFLLDKM